MFLRIAYGFRPGNEGGHYPWGRAAAGVATVVSSTGFPETNLRECPDIRNRPVAAYCAHGKRPYHFREHRRSPHHRWSRRHGRRSAPRAGWRRNRRRIPRGGRPYGPPPEFDHVRKRNPALDGWSSGPGLIPTDGGRPARRHGFPALRVTLPPAFPARDLRGPFHFRISGTVPAPFKPRREDGCPGCRNAFPWGPPVGHEPSRRRG